MSCKPLACLIECFLILSFLFLSSLGFSQNKDTLNKPLISIDKGKLLENITIGFDMRTEFQGYTFRGEGRDYNGVQFENGFTALRLSGQLHEKVHFNFRNRFNSSTEVQSLDRLSNNIQLAYVRLEANDKLDIYLGKMFAFYGGYEYEFSPLYVLEYNDIYSNALAFVTGAGLSYQAFDNHRFRFQVLNSRTLLYEDLYGDVVAENIKEPIWPVAVVANWRGELFDGKLQTNYSASYSNEVRKRGTYFFTLGHKYQDRNFTLMYDFQYSYEEIDTKGIISTILADENQVAENVLYFENWLRAEYQFSPKFKGLLTLMTSTAYDSFTTTKNHIRTSYGAIPTFYYSPFENLDLKFFLAYIGRYFDYTNYAKTNFDVGSYNKNEFRIGIIAPLNLL